MQLEVELARNSRDKTPAPSETCVDETSVLRNVVLCSYGMEWSKSVLEAELTSRMC